MIELTILLPFIKWYLIIAFFFLILNAFVVGYFGTELTKKDIWESIFWPVSFSVFLGACAKYIKEII